MKFLLALVLTGLFGVAQAVTPQLTIDFKAPTLNVDGTPIGGSLTYQVYLGASGKEIKYGAPIASSPYTFNLGMTPGQTVCAQVSTIANAVESIKSTEACATLPQPTPTAPITVTVTIALK